MDGIIKILPQIEAEKLNIKIVYAASAELFARQPESYRNTVLTPGDRVNSMIVTTAGRMTMHQWLFNKTAEKYTVCPDWDNQWRTGGSLEEVLDEAHLSPEWILAGVRDFVRDKAERVEKLHQELSGI